LPGILRKLLERLNDHFKKLDRQVEELGLQMKLWHKENEASQKLEAIPGIGPITLGHCLLPSLIGPVYW